MTHSDNDGISDARLEALAETYEGLKHGEIVVEGKLSDEGFEELIHTIESMQDEPISIVGTPIEVEHGWAVRKATTYKDFVAVYRLEADGRMGFVTFLPDNVEQLLGLVQQLFNYVSRDYKKPLDPRTLPAPKGYNCVACKHSINVHREGGCDVEDCECAVPFGRVMPQDER